MLLLGAVTEFIAALIAAVPSRLSLGMALKGALVTLIRSTAAFADTQTAKFNARITEKTGKRGSFIEDPGIMEGDYCPEGMGQKDWKFRRIQSSITEQVIGNANNAA